MTDSPQPSDWRFESASLLAARYGLESWPDAEVVSSPTIDLQLRHRSVRKFTAEPVTEAELTSIVAAAQSASQSSNLQIWSIVAVRDAERKRRISEAIGGRSYVEDAAVFLIWVADFHRAAKLVQAQDIEATTVGYMENTLVAFADSGITAQNALLAAESLGLGGVFVGSIRNNPAEVVAELGLPEFTFPVFGLAIGHPDPTEQAGTKPRLPQAAVLHHEQYDAEAWEQPVSDYENHLADYYAEFDKPNYSWARTIVRRLGSAAGLHGRDRMRDRLREQGYDSD